MDIGSIILLALAVGVAVWGAFRIAVYQIEKERKQERENHQD